MSKHFDFVRQAEQSLENPGEIVMPSEDLSISPRDAYSGQSRSPLPPALDEEQWSWLKPIRNLRTHWRTSTLIAALTVFAFACVTFLTKPVYEAHTRIEVDPPGETFSLTSMPSVASDRELLQTQAEVLRSDSLAVTVIRKLHLDDNETFVGHISSTPKNTAGVSPSDTTRLTPQENIALERFKDNLSITRDVASRLILVGFTSHDPQLAANVSNTLAQSFIEQSFETRHDAIVKSTEWLSTQLDDIRKKMESTRQALAQFQGSIGVVDADDNKNTFTERMGELTKQLTQAEAEKIQLQALLNSVQHGDPDSLPEVRTNPVVQRLSQELAEQRAQLSQVLVVYGKNHPAAKKLQSQVDELQRQLEAEKNAAVTSLRASYAAAEAREHLMAGEIKGTTKELDEMARYSALKKEVQTNTDLYNTLYTKIKEAAITAASKSADIRVLDEARVPSKPIRPRWLLNLLAGFMAAFCMATLSAFILEASLDKVRSPDDIKRCIGAQNVSVIPVISLERQNKVLQGHTHSLGISHGSAFEPSAKGDLFLLERPHSPESEALQGLYGSLMLSYPNNPPQVVLIASAFPNEGKTTIALNLSLAFAKRAKTCLVDADLRKGRIAKVFGVSPDRGLRDALTGPTELESVLQKVPGMRDLSLLSTGKSSHNAGQIICSRRMREIVEELRAAFRFVVIDSAPLLPFVDGRALSTMADAVVLVGRAGVTTRGAMQRSIDLLSEINAAPVLTVVLNAADISTNEYKYYRYGHNNYNWTQPS